MSFLPAVIHLISLLWSPNLNEVPTVLTLLIQKCLRCYTLEYPVVSVLLSLSEMEVYLFPYHFQILSIEVLVIFAKDGEIGDRGVPRGYTF